MAQFASLSSSLSDPLGVIEAGRGSLVICLMLRPTLTTFLYG